MRRGGDLLASGASPTVADTVSGDVMVAGAEASFTGVAAGDLLAAGGRLDLVGSVGGSVRAAGGDLRVATDMGRNATLAGGNVVLERTGRVRGNAYLAGGAVRVDGVVDELLRVSGGDVILNGVVGRDVRVEAGSLRLGPSTVITGDLRYRLRRGEELTVDPGARVEGRTIALVPRRSLPRWAPWWLALIGFLIVGVAAVAFAPRTAAAAAGSVTARPLASLGLGLAWLVLVPALVVVAAVTLVGLPLAVIVGMLYLISLCLAPVVPGTRLGLALLGDRERPSRGHVVAALLLGAPILVVLAFAPLVGFALWGLALVLGLGGLVLGLARKG